MKYKPSRRNEDRGYGRILTFFVRFFTVLGVAAFISAGLTSITLIRMMNYQPPALPDNILLVYKLKSNLFETTKKFSFKGPLMRPPTTLHEIAEAMDIAKKDPRVKGLALDIESSNYNLAQIQELRDAVHRFREYGKFAMVFADDIGGLSGGMKTYYLSSAFDEIWMQPMGMVGITGMHSETPFLSGLMETLGVTANFDHRGKYKSAMESITRTSMSLPHKEMMTSIIDDLSSQIISGVAEGRGLKPEHVKELINGAPYMGQESLDNKLIDKLDYYDNFIASAKEKSGEDIETIDLLGYGFGVKTENTEDGMVGFFTQLWHKKDTETAREGKGKVALIYGSGMIVPHKKSSSSLVAPIAGMGEKTLFADKISSAFNAAAKNDDVSVIVFRIDSPGGSPGAAETLRHAVVSAQEKGKKVVVSMGGTAASGGYWAVVNADHIIAEPGTLTGSIGVFAGKVVLDKLWKKLGVKWEAITLGDNADMWSMNSVFSETSNERFEAMLDNIYDNFIKIVAEGREMTLEEVEKVAQGRVWTGKQAKEIGLVDSLGGIEMALAYARELSGFEKEDDVPLVYYPAKKSTLELMIQLLTEGSASISPISVNIPTELQGIYNLWTLSKLSQEFIVISPIAENFLLR